MEDKIQIKEVDMERYWLKYFTSLLVLLYVIPSLMFLKIRKLNLKNEAIEKTNGRKIYKSKW